MKTFDFFQSRQAFYLMMGLLAAIPAVALVAAFTHVSFAASFEEVRTFISSLAGLIDTGTTNIVVSIIGYPVAFVVLAAGAYMLDWIGDMTLPRISAWCRHFGNPRARWSVAEVNHDWLATKRTYREINNIKGDRDKWERAKTNLGKNSVRFFRTAFYLSMLALIAGVADFLVAGEFRNRGVALIVIALIASPLFIALWAARQDKYVENLVSNLDQDTVPQSYRDALRRSSKPAALPPQTHA
jgi:hypothetical protein